MGLTVMGDILRNPEGNPENSNRREDSKGKSNVVTPKQAIQMGIPWNREPPEDKSCRFCGRTLEHEGLVFAGKVVTWRTEPRRCTCERAKVYWEKHDRMEAERKAAEAEEKRREALQRRVNRLLGRSGIKKRFQQRTFPNFITDTPGRKQNYVIAKEYADNFEYHRARGDGLYIEGTNGTGKTHLAAAIALQLINEGIPVICKTSSDLLLDIKKSFDSEGARESEVLDIYKRVDLLIIDDLGKEQCSDWSMSTLYSILNDRYEDMKPTIVTTNYNADALVTALTPKGYDNTKIVAIISRLREVSTVMTMAWADWRSGDQNRRHE